MNYLTQLIPTNNKILELENKINKYELELNKNKSLKVIHREKNKFEIIKTDINNIKQNYDIQNWKKNRPVDQIRVNDILNYYKFNNIKIVPGIVYAWYNNNVYYIYDGIHRITAANELDNNIKLILYINYSKNENDIICEFSNINKSISLPNIYIDHNNEIKKEMCESIVDLLSTNYPKFISPSKKPLVYNFNRDMLVEFISTINIDFNTLNIEKQVYNILMELNLEAKNNIINSNISHPKKCEKYNFYLLYLEKHYIKSRIESCINM